MCNYYKKYSKYNVCTPHRFNYRVVEESVLKSIREECEKYVDSTNFEKLLKDKEESKNKINEIKILISKSENTINKYKQQIKKVYMDNLNELINNDLFQTMQQELNDRIDEEEKHIQKLKED